MSSVSRPDLPDSVDAAPRPRRRELILKIASIVVSTLITLALCEGVLRLALFSDTFAVPSLRQPWRYAFEDTEDYWKLVYIFHAAARDAKIAARIHSELGWAPIESAENPLGLISDEAYRIEDLHRPVLFFGDSFVAGATAPADTIPQQLGHLTAGRPVLNYGVGGYGMDQIYLRFKGAATRFEDPLIIVGMLTHDLDRGILGMRTGQKPYFDVVNDQLVERNLPILAATREYVERHPPAIRSYLFRFVLLRLTSVVPEATIARLLGGEARQQRKLVVNERLLRAFRDDAKRLNVPLYAVVFFAREDFAQVRWKEQFLRQTLGNLGIPYFDTKAYLISYMERTGERLSDLYQAANGHPNEKCNRLLAEGLYEWLQARGAL